MGMANMITSSNKMAMMISSSSNKMNSKTQKNLQKNINFWSNTLRKNGFRKKNNFCPFWMLPQNFCSLLIQNTQRKK